MNINKAINLEIKRFKTKSDTLTLKVVEDFSSIAEKSFNDFLLSIEEDINSMYLEELIDQEKMQEVYDKIIFLSDVMENFKTFTDKILEKSVEKNMKEYDLIIDDFIEGLICRGIKDKNRICLEVKKISRYQMLRVSEQTNVVMAEIYESVYNRLNLNTDLFNALVEKEDSISVEEEIIEEEISEKSKREKITDVKSMIKVVERQGYTEIRQTGSHKVFKDSNGNVVTVPYHTSKDFNVGLGYTIQKQIGIC